MLLSSATEMRANMINDKIYQSIFDEVYKYLPSAWDKVVIYLEYGESSYSISFYVKKNGKYTKCYDLDGISDEEFYQSFKKINQNVMLKRNGITGDIWSNMTMVVEHSGKMHVDYDYTDLTEKAYQYSKRWAKIYLV